MCGQFSDRYYIKFPSWVNWPIWVWEGWVWPGNVGPDYYIRSADLDHEGDMEGSTQDTVKDVRMDACNFEWEILKCKSPNYPLNKQITILYVQNLESFRKDFDSQLVAIGLMGIKSYIYTTKRSIVMEWRLVVLERDYTRCKDNGQRKKENIYQSWHYSG